jgi:hypothetical protein
MYAKPGTSIDEIIALSDVSFLFGMTIDVRSFDLNLLVLIDDFTELISIDRPID